MFVFDKDLSIITYEMQEKRQNAPRRDKKAGANRFAPARICRLRGYSFQIFSA